jgi:DNA polymerase III epsilon subunit-like protein
MSAYIDNLPDLSNGYCVIDTETSGLEPGQDRVIELCIISCRGLDQGVKPVARSALVTTVEQVPDLITQITGITSAMLATEGVPPESAFQALFSLDELVFPNPPLPVVGHNILDFDRAFLLAEAQRIGGQCLERAQQVLNLDRIIDTGALYKGIRLGYTPFPGESHYQWAQRVLEIPASGLHWNLMEAARAYAVPAPRGEPHRARTDALTCHRLFAMILQEEALR